MSEIMQAWLERRESEMFALLRRLCAINSYTWAKHGVDEAQAVFRKAAEGFGFSVEIVPSEKTGDNLVIRNRAARSLDDGQKGVLFCGHMDTVFPPDSEFQGCHEEGANLVGPGVIDMKGGLVSGLYTMAALEAAGEDVPVTFVVNTDEETGSDYSVELIRSLCPSAAFAFVFECSGKGGEIVRNRKGKATYRLEVTGRAGHVGVAGVAKPSAILVLANLIVELEALNDPGRGISLNVGVVQGGMGSNTVPRNAHALIDTRHIEPADGIALEKSIEEIAGREMIPGVVARVTRLGGRPAMCAGAEADRLFDCVMQAGRELRLPMGEEFRGGVSDGNFISESGVPVVDGMGPSGELDHSSDEYMIMESFLQRTLLAGVATSRCWKARK